MTWMWRQAITYEATFTGQVGDAEWPSLAVAKEPNALPGSFLWHLLDAASSAWHVPSCSLRACSCPQLMLLPCLKVCTNFTLDASLGAFFWVVPTVCKPQGIHFSEPIFVNFCVFICSSWSLLIDLFFFFKACIKLFFVFVCLSPFVKS